MRASDSVDLPESVLSTRRTEYCPKRDKDFDSIENYFNIDKNMENEKLIIQVGLLKSERSKLELEAKQKREGIIILENKCKESEQKLKAEIKKREYFEKECTILQKKIADILSAYVGQETEGVNIHCEIINLREENNRKQFEFERLKFEVNQLSEKIQILSLSENEAIEESKKSQERVNRLELINKEIQRFLKLEHETSSKLRTQLNHCQNQKLLLEEKCQLFSHKPENFQRKNSNHQFQGEFESQNNNLDHLSILSQQMEEIDCIQKEDICLKSKELQEKSIKGQDKNRNLSLNQLISSNQYHKNELIIEIKTPFCNQNSQSLLSSLKEQMDSISEKKGEINEQLGEILKQSMRGNSSTVKILMRKFENQFEEFFTELKNQTECLITLKERIDEQDNCIEACKQETAQNMEQLITKHNKQVKSLQKDVSMLKKQKQEQQHYFETQLSQLYDSASKEISRIYSTQIEDLKLELETSIQREQDLESQIKQYKNDSTKKQQRMLEKFKTNGTENSANVSKTTRDSSAIKRGNGEREQVDSVSPFQEINSKYIFKGIQVQQKMVVDSSKSIPSKQMDNYLLNSERTSQKQAENHQQLSCDSKQDHRSVAYMNQSNEFKNLFDQQISSIDSDKLQQQQKLRDFQQKMKNLSLSRVQTDSSSCIKRISGEVPLQKNNASLKQEMKTQIMEHSQRKSSKTCEQIDLNYQNKQHSQKNLKVIDQFNHLNSQNLVDSIQQSSNQNLTKLKGSAIHSSILQDKENYDIFQATQVKQQQQKNVAQSRPRCSSTFSYAQSNKL